MQGSYHVRTTRKRGRSTDLLDQAAGTPENRLRATRTGKGLPIETRLRRGLFGYSRKSVTAVVNDREMAIITASRGTKEAKDEVEGLAAELDKRRIEAADLQARNRDLESKLDDVTERVRRSRAPAPRRRPRNSPTSLSGRAGHRAADLTDGARWDAKKQLGETEQVHEALRKEIDRFAAWRTPMAPLAQTIPDSIEEVRKETSALSDRLREALAPANDAMDALASRLSELAAAPEPPPHLQVGEPDVISVGEAGDETAPAIPDAELGVFPRPPDRPAPSSAE